VELAFGLYLFTLVDRLCFTPAAGIALRDLVKKTFCPRYSGTGYYPCFPFAIVFFGEDLFEPLSLARVEFGGRLRPTSSDCFGSDILSLGLGC
jgi:hypothetical protein